MLPPESAFVLMAIREYLQDVVEISEGELIGLPGGGGTDIDIKNSKG